MCILDVHGVPRHVGRFPGGVQVGVVRLVVCVVDSIVDEVGWGIVGVCPYESPKGIGSGERVVPLRAPIPHTHPIHPGPRADAESESENSTVELSNGSDPSDGRIRIDELVGNTIGSHQNHPLDNGTQVGGSQTGMTSYQPLSVAYQCSKI